MTDRHIFRRLLVANRGEVAARIARACEALGIEPVFAVSTADRDAPYTEGREVVVLGPSRASESYLDAERLVQAAVQSGCSALHPGWGFLAESPLLAALCEQHGVTFVGPPAHVMHRMGRKTSAKRAMRAAGVRVLPGSDGPLASFTEAEALAGRVGFPLLVKAESGGGGRGMRVARSPEELREALERAEAEARAAFGDPRVYLERFLEGARHVEIQVFADGYGRAVHLGERDCSIQRRHQKLIEESPSPSLSEHERVEVCEAAARAAEAVGYVGAGTMEFLLAPDGHLYFMEMNTRLQVEHPVTEMRTGLDLMALQLRVAAGERLPFAQEDVVLRGHAIECRINAEDPSRDFAPSPGRIGRWSPPDPEGGKVRCDTHVRSGYEVPPFYDSLLAKLVVWGEDREEARERMLRALRGLRCEGVSTTVPFHEAVLASEAFRTNRYLLGELPGWPPSEG